MEHITDLVYKQFLQEKAIIINEEIGPDIVNKCAMQIIKFNMEDDQLEKDHKCPNCKESSYDRANDPIKIYIHSPGGTVPDCLAVIGAIESSKTPIHTIALGEAQSAAFVILAAGDVRSCQKWSRIMYHELSTGMKGDLKYIKNKTEEAEALQAILDNIIVDKTNITQAQLDEKIFRKDWIVSAEEALEYGIVDFIEGVPQEEALEDEVDEDLAPSKFLADVPSELIEIIRESLDELDDLGEEGELEC